jgi:3-oxoacyl-[acyl-carrier protein] reductase
VIEHANPLAGTVALVTGATGGIGSAIALRLAELGAAVVVNHLDAPTEALRLRDQIRANGSKAIAIQADVRDEADVARLADEALFALGPVDTIVSAAGAYPRIPWNKLTPDHWRTMLDANLTSHYLFVVVLVRRLATASGGTHAPKIPALRIKTERAF